MPVVEAGQQFYERERERKKTQNKTDISFWLLWIKASRCQCVRTHKYKHFQFGRFTIMCAANVCLRKVMFSRCIMGKSRHVESARKRNYTVRNAQPIVFSLHVMGFTRKCTLKRLCFMTESYLFLLITWTLSLSYFQHEISPFAC